MDDAPKFSQSGACYLKDKLGNSIILKKSVWEKKTGIPERAFIALNFAKVKETICNPDHQRKSTKNDKARILYKHFPDIWLLPKVKVPFRDGFIAVVVQKLRSGVYTVKTIYSTDRLKKG